MMKKYKTKILIVLLLVLISVGFAYLSTNLSISGIGKFKPNTWDVHFANVVVGEMVNSQTTKEPVINSEGNQFDFGVNLDNPGSSYVLYADIVNAGTIDAMLDNLEITDVPEELKNIISVKLTYADSNSISKYDLLGKGLTDKIKVEITYIDPSSITDLPQEDGSLDFSVKMNYTTTDENAKISAGRVWYYDFTGTEQEFIVPMKGTYKIELWGASGGYQPLTGAVAGKGAYVSGNIDLGKNEKLYVYVGENPTYVSGQCYVNNPNASFNGALRGCCAGGGGATDVRLVGADENWSDFDSLKSRIMVAGAGGGAIYFGHGGNGGGLTGGDAEGYNPNLTDSAGTGATQKQVLFGKGVYNTCASGNGYYSGNAGVAANAGGGSSYISGYPGCDSISNESVDSTIIHTGNSVHYSGKVFNNMSMIAGDSSMPNPRGLGEIIGNVGNGYARITFVK